jgi:hypothetical protein
MQSMTAYTDKGTSVLFMRRFSEVADKHSTPRNCRMRNMRGTTCSKSTWLPHTIPSHTVSWDLSHSDENLNAAQPDGQASAQAFEKAFDVNIVQRILDCSGRPGIQSRPEEKQRYCISSYSSFMYVLIHQVITFNPLLTPSLLFDSKAMERKTKALVQR